MIKLRRRNSNQDLSKNVVFIFLCVFFLFKVINSSIFVSMREKRTQKIFFINTGREVFINLLLLFLFCLHNDVFFLVLMSYITISIKRIVF